MQMLFASVSYHARSCEFEAYLKYFLYLLFISSTNKRFIDAKKCDYILFLDAKKIDFAPFLGAKKIDFTPLLGAKKTRIPLIYGAKKINFVPLPSEKQGITLSQQETSEAGLSQLHKSAST